MGNPKRGRRKLSTQEAASPPALSVFNVLGALTTLQYYADICVKIEGDGATDHIQQNLQGANLSAICSMLFARPQREATERAKNALKELETRYSDFPDLTRAFATLQSVAHNHAQWCQTRDLKLKKADRESMNKTMKRTIREKRKLKIVYHSAYRNAPPNAATRRAEAIRCAQKHTPAPNTLLQKILYDF